MVFYGWLPLLSGMFPRFMHLVTCISCPSFLWLNTILFYRYTTFCSFICLLMNIWVVSTLGLFGTSFEVNVHFKFSFKRYLLIVQEARSLKPRCWQDHPPYRGWRGGPFLDFSSFWWLPAASLCSLAHDCLSPPTAFLCVSLRLLIF